MTDKTTEKDNESKYIMELKEQIDKNVIFPDITFVFKDGNKISCNKCIIAKYSKFFMDFFMENKDIKKDVDLSHITSILHDIFVLYLAVIYVPNMNLSIITYDSWIELYKLEDYLNSECISNLIKKTYLTDNMNIMCISYFNYYLNKDNVYIPSVIIMIEEYARQTMYKVIPFELFTPKLLWYYLDTCYISKNIDKYICDNISKFTSTQLALVLFKMNFSSIGDYHINSINIKQLMQECNYIIYDKNFIFFLKKLNN